MSKSNSMYIYIKEKHRTYMGAGCGVVVFAAFPVSASGALARAALVLVPATTGAAEAPWLG